MPFLWFVVAIDSICKPRTPIDMTPTFRVKPLANLAELPSDMRTSYFAISTSLTPDVFKQV